MPIKVLPDVIASQIAAGEVVERPVSVVKELLENAVDAGARSIQVEIQEAGRRLIAVNDDGEGIPSDEIAMAVGRHATSKLSKTEDLVNIQTLGFRGEALASIASVSRLELTSKPENQLSAARIVVDAGEVVVQEQASAVPGTQVKVEHLFSNVPARLKFLKADITETKLVSGLVTRYAMAYPEIRFTLIQDQKAIFQTSGSGNRAEILHVLYGRQDASQLLPITFQEGEYKVEGFVSNLSLNRSNRKDITLFVNGRWVQDSALTAAVIKAYAGMLMVGRYPVVILFISLPTRLVDVNVHPSKAEVRFRESDHVFSFMQLAVRRGLLAFTPIPVLDVTTLWGRPMPNQTDVLRGQTASGSQPDAQTDPVRQVQEVPRQQPLSGKELPLLRLVGQVASTYLVAEGPDGLYLIDQHAAHERVLFEQLMRQHQDHQVHSQALLTPATLELTPEKAAILESQLNEMIALGFEIEVFGPNTFLIRAVPELLARGDARLGVLSVIGEFEEDETPLEQAKQARIAARVCKRMAIKAGQILTEAEQKALLAGLEACQNPRTCPHGRPTMIHLSSTLLERQFGRSGAI